MRTFTAKSLARSPLIAGAVFVSLVAGSAGLFWVEMTEVIAERRALRDAQTMLAEMAARGGPPGRADPRRAGAPLLEGPTVTVAGASLLQRVTGAIAQVGGTIQSSQVDVGEGKDGIVSLLATSEFDQIGLQRLLYDLEAGMPYLTVDQLDIQLLQASVGGEPTSSERLRIVIGVSGRWLQKR